MAFSGMGSSGSSGRGRFRSSGVMSEMNVVPLVDVVLVLLIIFMVTASAMEYGLEIDVPKVKETSTAIPDSPVIVAIARGDKLLLDDKPVNINQLAKLIKQRYPNAKDVYLRADKSTSWEVVAKVFSVVGQAKYNVKALTKPEDVR